jgi:hypothetical protein
VIAHTSIHEELPFNPQRFLAAVAATARRNAGHSGPNPAFDAPRLLLRQLPHIRATPPVAHRGSRRSAAPDRIGAIFAGTSLPSLGISSSPRLGPLVIEAALFSFHFVFAVPTRSPARGLWPAPAVLCRRYQSWFHTTPKRTRPWDLNPTTNCPSIRDEFPYLSRSHAGDPASYRSHWHFGRRCDGEPAALAGGSFWVYLIHTGLRASSIICFDKPK